MKKYLVITILVLATITLSACTQSDTAKKNNVTLTVPTTNKVQKSHKKQPQQKINLLSRLQILCRQQVVLKQRKIHQK